MNMLKLNSKFLSLYVTVGLFFLLFGVGSINFRGFFSAQTFFNLFIDNCYLIILAVGMTFVLIIGGIDISIGSVIALSCMLAADLLEKKHFSPYVVILLVLCMGAFFGLAQGCLIHFFNMQPFIVTLGGLFFARGMTAVISVDTIKINNTFFTDVSNFRINIFGQGFISIGVVIALVVLALAVYIAHYTKFGRTAYAIGGNEQSAVLMGLPVGRTKVLIYTLNGFCSALAGIVFAFYILSGYTLHGLGMEMDAIASAVIGGTLLTGGVGYVFGTLFGVLIQGVIQTLVQFQGTLNSWWTKIAVASLLCLFIVMQRLFNMRKEVKNATKKMEKISAKV